jgi:hypothetical protein
MAQLIHVRLDDGTYLYLKSQKINLTELFSRLAKNYVDADPSTPAEEEQIMQEIIELKKQQKTISETLSEKIVTLSMIQERREKDLKTRGKEIVAYAETLKESGVMDDVGL